MKIENLKRSKLFYASIFAIIVICSITYYFTYYKNSPEYAVNRFFSAIKNSTPGQRDEEEIYQMTYYEKSITANSYLIGFEEMTKLYYKDLVLDQYKLKSKTKIDNDLYEFTILTEPKILSVTNRNRKDNSLNFFMIRTNGEWKFCWAVHQLPDSKLQEHEILYKRLIALQEDAKRNHTILY